MVKFSLEHCQRGKEGVGVAKAMYEFSANACELFEAAREEA